VIVVKWAVGQWSPLTYSVWRNWLGVIVLLAFVKRTEGSVRIERRDFPLVACSALIGIVINQLGFMYATTYTTATTISLVLASIPAFAAVSSSVLGHERISSRHWAGIGVAAIGTVLVLEGGPGHLDLTSLRGDLLALLAAATWGVYSALAKPLFARYSPNRASTIVLCAAVPMLTVVGLPQVVHQDYGAITLGGWGALIFSVFFGLVFTNILWFGAIHRGGAARATAVMPIQPFLGALFAFVLLDERVTLAQVVGGLVIVLGIWLTRRRSVVTSSA
jgi:drug/metabolite transporter (DMT)-like permease